MKKPFRLDMLTLEGSARQRGQSYGETLREKINANIEDLKASIIRKTGQEGDAVLAEFVRTTKYLERAEERTPHLVEEVRGIADGANLPFTTAFALQSLEGLVSGEAMGACSALGIWGQPGKPTLLAQTADNSSTWHDKLTLLHIRYPESDLEVYTMAFSGFVGVYGINNYGMGVCINSLGELKHGKDGLSAPLVSRRLLETKTLQEADAFIRSVNHIAGENFLIGSPEKTASYECSANQVAEYIPPNNAPRLFHTNHALANEDKIEPDILTEEVRRKQADRMANTLTRLATLQDHLGGDKPVAVEDIKQTLSTHGEHPICNHLDDHNPGNVTNYGIVMELSTRPVLHLSSGPPCYTQFWQFKF
jgi:isopenicillin-N N-acyltransferase-like protein